MHLSSMRTAPAPALLRTGIRLQREGRAAEAAALYRLILEGEPEHPRALMLLGMVLADAGELAEAETLFRRYLGLAPGEPVEYVGVFPLASIAGEVARPRHQQRLETAIVLFELGKARQRRGDDPQAVFLMARALAYKPDYPPALNDLGVSLHRLGRRDAALAAFERAAAIDPAFATAQRNKGSLLLELHRIAEGVACLEKAVEIEPNALQTWLDLGGAYITAEDWTRAETAFRRILAIDPGHIEAHLQLAHTLERRHRFGEARRLRIEAGRLHGVATVPCSGATAEARVLVLGGAGLCNASLQFLLPRRRFEMVSAYLPPEATPDEQRRLVEKLPRCDVVFNAIADADAGGPFLAAAARLCDEAGRPVINPPGERIARTRRDLVPALLAGIPGLIVPETRRLGRSEAEAFAAVDARLERPVLIRPAGTHGGEDLVRADRRSVLRDYLRATPCDAFYVTDYWDYASADGYHRKYRLIFVDRAVYPYHLVIGRHWLLHYFRVDMQQAAWMRPEEEAFLADYRTVFQGALAETLAEVARRMDLDFAGIDCALTPDGRVLLFEANATMLVHLHDSPTEYPYKHRYVPRIIDAVGRMVVERARARG